MNFKILDCTLRDGGYYTNWDFDRKLVDTYIKSFNSLPVEYLEVGYRSPVQNQYHGEYFYLPNYVMKRLKDESNKKLVIILNEKDVKPEDAEKLLKPCLGLITMVRLAIDPEYFERAIGLAKVIKAMGFEVGFNVMYMSKWKQYTGFLDLLPKIEGVADYFYMVDSYGGVYPEDVKETIGLVREKINIPLGFHGHNNMELGLINTLTAIELGVELVDATVTGMGRGAGNLKTELLFTALNAKGLLEIDFNALSKVVDDFSELQKQYEWGANLPYMVSGANSLPQKDVMDWVGKRYYSFNSIIRALQNKSQGIVDNENLALFHPPHAAKEVLLVGGGPSVKIHEDAIKQFLIAKPDCYIIHASSKNALIFNELSNKQYFCLVGNEGHRMEEVFNKVIPTSAVCILPPYPRKMGTYIPAALKANSFQLSNTSFANQFLDSHTAIALQSIIELNAENIYLVGYDGYFGEIGEKEKDLIHENEFLFNRFSEFAQKEIVCLTPSAYKKFKEASIYSLV
jgi:4-hydroxy 2-oxovalerate aldolase